MFSAFEARLRGFGIEWGFEAKPLILNNNNKSSNKNVSLYLNTIPLTSGHRGSVV